MTNLDSILKSRDITLLTKVHIVRAMVFLVVMWELGYKEGWVPKNWCFQIMMLEKTFESPLNSKKINKSILKEINSEYSLEGLMMKLQYFGHLMWRADTLKKILMLGKTEGKRRWRQQRMRWLDSITNSMDINMSNLREIVKDREAWSTVVHGVAKNWTRLSNWTTTPKKLETFDNATINITTNDDYQVLYV